MVIFAGFTHEKIIFFLYIACHDAQKAKRSQDHPKLDVQPNPTWKKEGEVMNKKKTTTFPLTPFSPAWHCGVAASGA